MVNLCCMHCDLLWKPLCLDPSDGVFGRFDLAALCGCHTLNVCCCCYGPVLPSSADGPLGLSVRSAMKLCAAPWCMASITLTLPVHNQSPIDLPMMHLSVSSGTCLQVQLNPD